MKYQIDFRNYGWAIIFLFFLLLSTKTFFNIPLILLSISGIYVLVKNKTIDMGKANIRLFGIMYLCIIIPMILSLFDAVSFNESLRKTITFILFYPLGVAIILSLANPIHKKYLLYSIFFLMCFWILDAIWQSISGYNILGYQFKGKRITGMFHPSSKIGIVLANLSPFYFEVLRIQFHKRKWILLLVLPLIYVVILSGGRSSYIMLLLSSILYVIYLFSIGAFARVTKNNVVVILSIIVFGGIILFNSDKIFTTEEYEHLEKRFSSIGDYFSGDAQKIAVAVPGRMKIWESAIWVARDNWVNGVGPRGFRYVADDYIEKRNGYIISEHASSSTHPHQYFLEILTETGVFGIIGYLIFLIILYHQIYIYFRHDKYKHLLPWTFPALIVTMPVNIHMAFYGNYIATFICVTVAIVMSLEIGNNSNTAKQKHD
jgi:O-antigen ligase